MPSQGSIVAKTTIYRFKKTLPGHKIITGFRTRVIRSNEKSQELQDIYW